MVTVNIVPALTPTYFVDDAGAVNITLTDTANTYADDSNQKKVFIVIPKVQTLPALNAALILAKEDSIDYFTSEASDNRSNAKSITVRWNQSTWSTVAKNLLITAYQVLMNPPDNAIKNTLITDIGTVIPS